MAPKKTPLAAPAKQAPISKASKSASSVPNNRPGTKAAVMPVKPVSTGNSRPTATKATPQEASRKPATQAPSGRPAQQAPSRKPATQVPSGRPAQQAPAKKKQIHGIHIGGWGKGSVDDLKAMFASAGKIIAATIRRHHHALLFFETAAEVKKAIEIFTRSPLRNTQMTISPSKTRLPVDPHMGSSVVFISPIFRGSTSKAQLVELFKGLTVKRVRMYRYNYAYVYLSNAEEAIKAIERLNGTQFLGHQLTVKLSTRSLKKDRKRYAQALAKMRRS